MVIGALADGTKEVLAVVRGYRESSESWKGLFADLKARGLDAPKLMVADGAAGAWAAAKRSRDEVSWRTYYVSPRMNQIRAAPRLLFRPSPVADLSRKTTSC